MNDDEREATAYHEAGHTVMGFICGRVPTSVDIIPDARGNAGHTHFSNDDVPVDYRRYLNASPEKQHYLKVRVLIALAGTAAHDLICLQRQHDTGDMQDELYAKALIEDSMSWDDEHDTALERLKIETYAKIAENKLKVEAIAAMLLRQDMICASEIQLLLR